MNILGISSRCNEIVEAINQHSALFHAFESVYLFGSVLCNGLNPEDLDLLLVYSNYTNELIDEINQIRLILEMATSLPADLTVMSLAEVEETAFLHKIVHYLQLK